MKKLFMALLVVALAVVGHAATANLSDVVPPVKVIAVTASDATEYLPPLVSLYIGGTGDVQVIGIGGKGTYTCADAPVHKAVAVGLLRVRAYKVCANLTTATDILGYRKDP